MPGVITRAGLAAAVAVVALFGCTDDQPGTAPTTLPSITLTPSAPATPSDPAAPSPTPPAQASAHTPDGAAAFVRFYIDLINTAYATGASQPLRAYATDECDSCTSIAGAVDDIYADGGRAIGGQLTINTLTPTGVAEGVQTSVVVDASTDAYQRIDSSGAVVEDLPSVRRLLIVDLGWTNSAWRASGIRSEEVPQ